MTSAELLTHIVQAICEFPESVKINHLNGTRTDVFEISVDESDRGRIIGKGGYTHQALQTIFVAIARGKEDKHTKIVIL